MNNTFLQGSLALSMTISDGAGISSAPLSGVTFMDNKFLQGSTFLYMDIRVGGGISTEATFIDLGFSDLTFTTNQFEVSAVIEIPLQKASFPCVERIRLNMPNSTFANNTFNSSAVISTEDPHVHVSITSLDAQNNTFNQGYFANLAGLSSVFLSNSNITNCSISEASFLYSSYKSDLLSPGLETCSGNAASGEVFGQVRPFILYNNSFNVINLQSDSALIRSANPKILIQANTFARITINNSKIVFIENSIDFFPSNRAHFSNLTSKVDIYMTVTKMSVFAAAEEELFINDTVLYQIYQVVRGDLSLQDADNSIFFISIAGNFFDTVNVTASSDASVVIEDYQMPYNSINISSKSFKSVTSEDTFSLIKAVNIVKTYFTKHLIEDIDINGYFLLYTGTVTSNLFIESNTLSNSQKLSFFSLQGDQCNLIKFQNNQVSDLVTQQTFINVACGAMRENLKFQKNLFNNIIVANDPNDLGSVEFLKININGESAGSEISMLEDNTFFNISNRNTQRFSAGRYQVSFLLIASAQSTVQLLNNRFDSISIVPQSSVMEIYA